MAHLNTEGDPSPGLFALGSGAGQRKEDQAGLDSFGGVPFSAAQPVQSAHVAGDMNAYTSSPVNTPLMDRFDYVASSPSMLRMPLQNAHPSFFESEMTNPYFPPDATTQNMAEIKRRRTTPAASSGSPPSPSMPEFGTPGANYSTHGFKTPGPLHQTPPNAFNFTPMLSFSSVETPSSGSTASIASLPPYVPATLSPLAHRGCPRGVMDTSALNLDKQGYGMMDVGKMDPAAAPFPDPNAMRRSQSQNCAPNMGDSEFFFRPEMPVFVASPPQAQGAPLPPGSMSTGTSRRPSQAPSPLERQYSAPMPQQRPPRAERSEKKPSTDVWPDDVEVAFWEALRLIPKLGRRKVLVNGKPCGRNELIADYIERRTNKVRSRKQVSSHIQVLKNVKRGDPEFQQLMAEPVSEEDYYTPAGGMVYAQSLADYSNGLLSASALSSDSGQPSPLLSVSPVSPLHAGPTRSSSVTGTSSISSALSDLHLPSSPAMRNGRSGGANAGSQTPVAMENTLPSAPLPSAFSIWTYSSKREEKHVYTKLDTSGMSRVLQGAPLPVVPIDAPGLSANRFPKLPEMRNRLGCQFLLVHVPLSVPRHHHLSPATFDRLNTALSFTSTKNGPLTSVTTVYSHGKCVLSLVEPLEAPRPIAQCRSEAAGGGMARSLQQGTPTLDGSTTGPSSPVLSGTDGSKSPQLGTDRYRWAYQAPFARDFWANFLSRNHPVHMYGNGRTDTMPSFSKEPSERAALGMALAGITFVQELVVPREDKKQTAQMLQGSPAAAADKEQDVCPGSKLGDVVLVVAWELECVEALGEQPGTTTVSIIGPPAAHGSATSVAAAPEAKREEPALGLQLHPPGAAPPKDRPARSLRAPETPTVVRMEAPPQVPCSAAGATASVSTPASAPASVKLTPAEPPHALMSSPAPMSSPLVQVTTSGQGLDGGATAAAAAEQRSDGGASASVPCPLSKSESDTTFTSSPSPIHSSVALDASPSLSMPVAAGLSAAASPRFTNPMLSPVSFEGGETLKPPSGVHAPVRANTISVFDSHEPSMPSASVPPSAAMGGFVGAFSSNSSPVMGSASVPEPSSGLGLGHHRIGSNQSNSWMVSDALDNCYNAFMVPDSMAAVGSPSVAAGSPSSPSFSFDSGALPHSHDNPLMTAI